MFIALTASPALATSPLSLKTKLVSWPFATAELILILIESPAVIWAPVVALIVD